MVDPVGRSFSKNILGNFVDYVVCVIVYFFSFLFVNPYTMKWRIENKICEESVTMATSLAAISGTIQIMESEINNTMKLSNQQDPVVENNLKNLQDMLNSLLYLKTTYRSCGHMEDLTDAVKNVSNKIVKNYKVVSNIRNITQHYTSTFNTVSDTMTEIGLDGNVML